MAKAKFDIKTEATRPLYAGVGVGDIAVGFVREYVTDVQKKFAGVQKDVQTRIGSLDLEPKALRDQAVTVVSARVDALSKDAKARRNAIEARVAELQADAQAIPATVSGTYADLAKRGETLVERIRKQQSTQQTVTAAKTTTAKAKTTKTQAKKASSTTAKKTAKKASTTAKKTSTAPKSSAKATATAAKKTASSAATAATEAAEKVGD
jgi:heparin binding hemagglutinin HbhA